MTFTKKRSSTIRNSFTILSLLSLSLLTASACDQNDDDDRSDDTDSETGSTPDENTEDPSAGETDSDEGVGQIDFEGASAKEDDAPPSSGGPQLINLEGPSEIQPGQNIVIRLYTNAEDSSSIDHVIIDAANAL